MGEGEVPPLVTIENRNLDVLGLRTVDRRTTARDKTFGVDLLEWTYSTRLLVLILAKIENVQCQDSDEIRHLYLSFSACMYYITKLASPSKVQSTLSMSIKSS